MDDFFGILINGIIIVAFVAMAIKHKNKKVMQTNAVQKILANWLKGASTSHTADDPAALAAQIASYLKAKYSASFADLPDPKSAQWLEKSWQTHMASIAFTPQLFSDPALASLVVRLMSAQNPKFLQMPLGRIFMSTLAKIPARYKATALPAALNTSNAVPQQNIVKKPRRSLMAGSPANQKLAYEIKRKSGDALRVFLFIGALLFMVGWLVFK